VPLLAGAAALAASECRKVLRRLRVVNDKREKRREGLPFARMLAKIAHANALAVFDAIVGLARPGPTPPFLFFSFLFFSFLFFSFLFFSFLFFSFLFFSFLFFSFLFFGNTKQVLSCQRLEGRWRRGVRLHAGERAPPNLSGVLADARAGDDGVERTSHCGGGTGGVSQQGGAVHAGCQT